MKTNFLILLTLIAFCSLSKNTNAQAVLSPLRMEVFMELSQADSSATVNDTLFAPTAQLKGRMVIVLEDSISISKIHVKLGTTNGASNLVNKVFTFDQAGTFADGTSYKREGLVVYLGLGNFTGLNVYFGEAKLEDINGTIGTPVNYDNN